MGKGALGEAIRRSRINSGLTQKQLAEKLEMSQPVVSNWESGKFSPDAKQRSLLEAILGPLESGREEDHAEDFGPGPVGTWLARTRESKGLTVNELAEKAGISHVAIRNIEAGRSLNPHERTLRRLEKALDEKLPDEAQREAEREATIEGIGEFINFDPHDAGDLPEEPGVYVLYDISERPIYVGEGQIISKRIRDHDQKFWFKRPIVAAAAYVPIKDEGLRRQVEKILIKFLKSNAVLNKEHVDRR